MFSNKKQVEGKYTHQWELEGYKGLKKAGESYMFLPRVSLTLQWWEWKGKPRNVSSAGNLFNLQEIEDEGKFAEEISLDFVKKRDCDLISCLHVSARALLFLDLCCPLIVSTVYQETMKCQAPIL